MYPAKGDKLRNRIELAHAQAVKQFPYPADPVAITKKEYATYCNGFVGSRDTLLQTSDDVPVPIQ